MYADSNGNLVYTASLLRGDKRYARPSPALSRSLREYIFSGAQAAFKHMGIWDMHNHFTTSLKDPKILSPLTVHRY
jgi:hypothetical protein